MAGRRFDPEAGHRRLSKRLLPRGLFGRTLLIIVMPVLLLQVIAVWVFYDRHWNAMSERLVQAVMGEIALVIDRLEGAPDAASRLEAVATANAMVDLLISYRPEGELGPPRPPPVWDPFVAGRLDRALDQRIGLPHRVDSRARDDWIQVEIEMPDGAILEVLVRGTTSHIFLAWMLGSAGVLVAVSLLFMRNQIRPIRRLAVAAERFGKGRDVPDFQPEGATEVRQAAAAFLGMRARIQRQIAQRTELLAGVSHDLRTPLTRMKLQLSLLGDAPARDRDELAGDIAEMERMIEAYLDFARQEGQEAMTELDLGGLLAEIVETARRDGAEIALDAPEALTITARTGELRRCIANLLGNARRYGGARIWLTATRLVGLVEIAVEDDGPGLPEDRLDEVFKPFTRGEASRNPRTGGVGLGLTIARDIARGHGGDIQLARSRHGGLRAAIRLPL